MSQWWMEKEVSYEEVKTSAKKDRELLTPYEIMVDEIYKTGKTKRLSPKNCYKKSFDYVAGKDLDTILLVHGKYKPYSLKKHSGHAWVEIENKIVFDGVLQSFYEKDEYYQYYDIIKENQYTCTEMWEVGFKNGGNFGPWINRSF